MKNIRDGYYINRPVHVKIYKVIALSEKRILSIPSFMWSNELQIVGYLRNNIIKCQAYDIKTN